MFRITLPVVALGLGLLTASTSLASLNDQKNDTPSGLPQAAAVPAEGFVLNQAPVSSEVCELIRLPRDPMSLIFRHSDDLRAFRATCRTLRDCVDADVSRNATKMLNLYRPGASDAEAETEEVSAYTLSCLFSLLQKVQPRQINCFFNDLTEQESIVIASSPNLKYLSAMGMNSDHLAVLSPTLEVLDMDDPRFANLSIFRPEGYIFDLLLFNHLPSLKQIKIKTDYSPDNLVLDMSLYPASLEDLEVLVPFNSGERQQYRLANCASMRNLKSLKCLSLPYQHLAVSNFSDLSCLHAENIEILNLSGCPLIQDYTPLLAMPKLTLLTVRDDAQLPALPASVDVEFVTDRLNN